MLWTFELLPYYLLALNISEHRLAWTSPIVSRIFVAGWVHFFFIVDAKLLYQNLTHHWVSFHIFLEFTVPYQFAESVLSSLNKFSPFRISETNFFPVCMYKILFFSDTVGSSFCPWLYSLGFKISSYFLIFSPFSSVFTLIISTLSFSSLFSVILPFVSCCFSFLDYLYMSICSFWPQFS